MIVAPPDEIPFEFQFGLDLNWAVGRLWFDDEAEFGRYAESVVAYETGKSIRVRDRWRSSRRATGRTRR